MNKYLSLNKNIGLALIILLLTSCASYRYVTKQEAFPHMYNETPHTILVLPPLNESTAADAIDYYLTTVLEPLAESGFYVFPIDIIANALKSEGIYDSAQLLGLDPSLFKDFFGADAVLYTSIKKWDTNYIVISGSVVVRIAFELKSTHTGITLWAFDQEVTISTTDNSSNFLVALIATAIKTATQDYVPVARQVNYNALRTMPYGQYHELFNKDQELTSYKVLE